MTIFLKNIWPVENVADYKIHFARWNGHNQPLEVWARDEEEWQGWQEYYPGRNDFNRPYIFSLIQFYHETDVWLFGGIYEVLDRLPDHYKVKKLDAGGEFIGRLKIKSSYRERTTRPKMENHYDDFEVKEILSEPYSGRSFPGYNRIEMSFEELETLIERERVQWKTALENIKGVYLITDTKTGKRYVGSAYGEQGIWGRWGVYVKVGHGFNKGLIELVDNHNKDLVKIVEKSGLDYCRQYFRFALLEDCPARMTKEDVINRESFWKTILLTRGETGLNRN
ncbi:MAG TPA: GIY-YIG nuclease family protein [Alphaproteobacteria bacterium]|nr:GIY-YIG nuclease family protein [Alphaproteobacteria bacterium]HOO49906.1 GIY-YIG nuclease family protein [Alphaproteobacteria bacterium]